MLGVVEIVIVEVADPPAASVTGFGFSDDVGPFATMGETVAVKETEPAKPPVLFTATVAEVDDPGLIVLDEGRAESWKSRALPHGTWNAWIVPGTGTPSVRAQTTHFGAKVTASSARPSTVVPVAKLEPVKTPAVVNWAILFVARSTYGKPVTLA